MFSKQKSKVEKKTSLSGLTDNLACLIPSEHLRDLRELGEGQYGVVHLGEWKPPQGDELKQVAIKSIKNTEFDGVLRCILREAQTMQKLCHNNIVKLYGISLPSAGKEQQLRLITEFAQYGSLEENFKKKNKNVLKVSTLCKFASQVAHGMDYLASQQLIHRDLATRNILLFEQDLVKISDFGLARSLEGEAVKVVSLRTKLAFAWMAPEVLSTSVYTTASDVWSYGITLWEMLSFGQKPWADCSLSQIKEMVVGDPSKRLSKPCYCPDGFYELIMLKCWANDPKDRPPFKHIIENLLPQVQPKEGTTRVSHKAADRKYLSYGSKEKVTVISRVGEGVLLAQREDISIGCIEEKNVEFPKKVGGSLQISSPFKVKKRDSREVLAELQKRATNNPNVKEDLATLLHQTKEKQTDRNLLDLEVDEVALDPDYMLYPDPYPAMTDWPAKTASARPDSKVYVPMGGGEKVGESEPERAGEEDSEEDDYMSMETPASLQAQDRQESKTRQSSLNQSHLSQRPSRTMSESQVSTSDYERIWDIEYAVPFQNAKGSKDDSSLQLTSNGTPQTIKRPPVIPPRPDLVSNTEKAASQRPDRTIGVGSYGTTSRKRPIPTPRQKARERLRPLSDDLSNKSDPDESRRRSNTDIGVVNDTKTAPSVDSQKKLGPQVPAPYEPKRIQNGAEVGVEGENTAIMADSEELNKLTVVKKSTVSKLGQGAAAGLTSESCHDNGSSGASQKPRNENSSITQDLIDFSSDSNECPPLPPKQHATLQQPVYHTPVSNSLCPNIPDHEINQPSPLPPRKPDISSEATDLAYNIVPLFDDSGNLVNTRQPPVEGCGLNALRMNPLPSSAAAVPVSQAAASVCQGGSNFKLRSAVTGSDNSTNNLNSVISHAIKLENQALRPANPVSESANPPSAKIEKSYGHEIDAGIQEIQDVCGKDVSRDWCYAALLQYECDVKQAIENIKVQKLATITGKSEAFCRRTLKHCSWDMDRAAVYIMENFQEVTK